MCILVAKCQLLSSFELYNVYVKCNFGTELPLDKKLIKKNHQCMQFVFNKEKKEDSTSSSNGYIFNSRGELGDHSKTES